jgi:hypothetical protein
MSLRDTKALGHIDFESTEFHIRSSMHGLGGKILEELLNSDNGGHQGQKIICDNNCEAEFKEYRNKKLQTVLGNVSVKRAYYYDSTSKTGHCPKDTDLDILGTSFSPGLRRIMSRVGAYRPFALGHDDIKEMAGISVTSKEIERTACQLGEDADEFYKKKECPDNVIPFPPTATMYICVDGTGVPVVKTETIGRKGKHENGEAKTREAKLGCVFTQTSVDKDGYPVRNETSTSYVGAIENAEDFGNRIYKESTMRGVEKSKRTCVIGDGALWIWNLAELHFYNAIQIVDLYHAREHCWKIGKEILGADKKKMILWVKNRINELDQGKIERLIAALEKLSPTTETEKESVQKKINYFDKNKERMRYKKFRQQGLFVGSGVIEAGCRAVVGQRLKQSGMHWTVKHANNIIALRCCMVSNRWEDFWENRASSA